MRATLFSVMALGSLGLLVASCSDPRCSKANIDAVATACRVEAAGSSSYSWCRRSGLTPPADYDFSRHQVSACNAAGAGQVIGCLAGKATACATARADGGFSAVDAVITSCQSGSGGGGAATADCWTACHATEATCEKACALTSWDVCADCSSTCALQELSCDDTCPKG